MGETRMQGASIPSEEEVERALRRAWFPIARSADVGHPQRAVLLGELLVVFRTETGEIAAATEHCPHRGASLAAGWIDGETIACPYHGWRWRASDGRCAHVPSLGPLSADRAEFPSRAVLRTYRVEERYGLVWCCLDEPAVKIPSPPQLDDRWRYDWVDPVPVQAGIRNATENFRDVAHFPFVHRASMGRVPEKVEPLKVRREGAEVWLDRTYRAEGGTAGMYDSPDGRIHFTYHAIAPAFVFIVLDYGSGGRRMVVQTSSPTNSAECTIYFGAGISDDYTEGTLEAALQTEAAILAEDIPILNSLSPPESPLDGTTQPSTAADRYTLEYRKAFIDFVRSVNRSERAAIG